MNEGSTSIEDKAETFLTWYEKQQPDFARSTYLNNDSDLQLFTNPHTNWNSSSVLKKEIEFNLSVVAKIKSLFANWPVPEQKTAIGLILLCLKNRSEYASNKADFYPVYAALIVFTCSTVVIAQEPIIKFLLGMLACVVLIFTFKNRVETRRRVSHIKELINVLELYKSNLS